jgi:hypothetical protein
VDGGPFVSFAGEVGRYDGDDEGIFVVGFDQFDFVIESVLVFLLLQVLVSEVDQLDVIRDLEGLYFLVEIDWMGETASPGGWFYSFIVFEPDWHLLSSFFGGCLLCRY